MFCCLIVGRVAATGCPDRSSGASMSGVRCICLVACATSLPSSADTFLASVLVICVLPVSPTLLSSPTSTLIPSQGNHERAVEYFRRALRLSRHYLSAWTLMGHEYVEMKNAPAAIGEQWAIDASILSPCAWGS